MIRPLLSLERLSLDERTGKVGYQYGKEAKDVERMDSLEFIARVTSKTVNTIENGIYVPSTVLALKMARVFGVAVEDIFQLAEPFPPENDKETQDGHLATCRLGTRPV